MEFIGLYCQKICARSRKTTWRLGWGMVFVFSDINGGVNTLGDLVCGGEKSLDLKLGSCLNCSFKMSSLPPGNSKPTYLATRKLDESLLSASHMADGGGGHCGAQPSSLRWVPFGPHVHSWQRTVQWFFLSKYLQCGQSLLLSNSRLPSAPVESRRPDGACFFICLAAAPLTRPVPHGIAVATSLLLECACKDFRTVVRRSAVSLGSQVWVINFQCCCLTINEVMAPGQDWLHLSDVSHLPADVHL